eukprot:CAMPEP_0181335004 /NCGR_PEP_ID=MMETSP1101-20121128/26590_1 /TAXON_ID=46948 /ORGANISM="Rhodomonas abbreviata, Strain Caron Lab Isolate" /LENGTH=107 /DNA_ID=CAMNT_0023445075 /DNA_START=474 /DNA_END=797 /DNA_ORIENTATION=-
MNEPAVSSQIAFGAQGQVPTDAPDTHDPHSSMSMQIPAVPYPDPKYPGGQEHVKDPTVLVQIAFMEQMSFAIPAAHSSTSLQKCGSFSTSSTVINGRSIASALKFLA